MFKGSTVLIGLLSLFLFSACKPTGNATVDKLNSMSYAYHYRNLDSVKSFALKALDFSSNYSSGKAEAYNNLVFADIALMDYERAYARLDSVALVTDNQVELLLADVQYMRLCQRESKNKDFYYYRERAIRRMMRIEEEKDNLAEHIKKRYLYAQTEFQIVCSTYYYYVGLAQQAANAISQINLAGGIQADTAQYVNYLYQIGSGGILDKGTVINVQQKEFEYLFKCYVLSRRNGLLYWQANALQAISEHLLDENEAKRLIRDNKAAIMYLNEDNMPDSLLAGYFAQKALDIFKAYGDIYQTAGAYRTLSQCYFALGDYQSSLICLENALYKYEAISKTPDLIASIRECLSLVYSAMGDKNNSDINRNAYLDIQEYTRQDRQLEARAEMLGHTSSQLNFLITAIVVMMVIVCVLLYIINLKGRKKYNTAYMNRLLTPLMDWEQANKTKIDILDNKLETLNEQLSLTKLQLEKSKKRSLDNKAKVFLLNNVIPFIDRIINEAASLKKKNYSENKRKGDIEYMSELADKISEYNEVLTHWIQLQQGELNLHIESFRLQDVFSILSKSEMSFRLKGIKFDVEPTDIIVKADKVLTLFMLNTLSDNARKFTPHGGIVKVSATKATDYVEISVKDTGKGLSQGELSKIFDHKIYNGHGFGLMNCKGIIDKYKKISQIFNICGLFAESEKNNGSRFFFRLPYGVIRTISILLLIFTEGSSYSATYNVMEGELLRKAGIYADSAYYSNLAGNYEKTLIFADSARIYLNKHHKIKYPQSNVLMSGKYDDAATPAEILWFTNKFKTNYDIILDIRNESAVAALALHKLNVYTYNNKIYTRLFKELSSDKGLEDYCVTMQSASSNKTIAIVVLVLMLTTIIFAYYFLYYRHILYFRSCADKIRNTNKILLSNIPDDEKLKMINGIDASNYPEALKNVIGKIKRALHDSVEFGKSKLLSIELEEDELHRVSYEKDKLYVCNSIIDNSLSTLKHETMYYPARIKHLLNVEEDNINAVSEVVSYYKELYSILYEQVRLQSDAIMFECKSISLKDMLGVNECVLGDKTLIAYLFDILKHQCGCHYSSVKKCPTDGKYVIIEFVNNEMSLKDKQCQDFFSPSIRNIPFMICRQVLREIAEQTNLHGCGITVTPLKNGGISINLTFAKAVKRIEYANAVYK